jgi:hypothetical protein
VSICSSLSYSLALVAFLISAAPASAMKVRDLRSEGVQPSIVDEQGRRKLLYKESHALLISESAYKGIAKKGWRPLEHTGQELDQVAKVLQRHGFHVRRIEDANGAELYDAFRKFLADYGRDPDVRLVLFFSGHGHTVRETDLGYLVPVDAPDPNIDPAGFLQRALPIRSLQLLAEEISARHALFVFDSCFSGSIFMTKGAPKLPEVTGKAPSDRQQFFLGAGQKAVRQFIAAGGPGELLPAKSVFTPLFIKALEGGAAISADGYLTGKEMGLWLEQTLPKFNSAQNPHSDVIRIPILAFGDMVFQIGRTTTSIPLPVPESIIPPARGPVAIPDPPPETPANAPRLRSGLYFYRLDVLVEGGDYDPLVPEFEYSYVADDASAGLAY